MCHLFCKICLDSQGRLSFSLSDTHFSQAKVLGRLGGRKKRLCWSTPTSGSLKNLHPQYYQSRATQREPGSSSPIIANRSQGKPDFQGPHGCCQRGQGCLFPANSLPPNFHGDTGLQSWANFLSVIIQCQMGSLVLFVLILLH